MRAWIWLILVAVLLLFLWLERDKPPRAGAGQPDGSTAAEDGPASPPAESPPTPDAPVAPDSPLPSPPAVFEFMGEIPGFRQSFDDAVDSGEVLVVEGFEVRPGVPGRMELGVEILNPDGSAATNWQEDALPTSPQPGGIDDPFAPKDSARAKSTDPEEPRRALQILLAPRLSADEPGGDVLAAPSIVTRSGQSAKVEIVREIILPEAYDATGQPSAFRTLNTGLEIDLKPEFTDDGLVRVRGEVRFTPTPDLSNP